MTSAAHPHTHSAQPHTGADTGTETGTAGGSADGPRPATEAGTGFHPHLPDRPARNAGLASRLHHVRAGELDGDTAQTGGMRRFAAVSGQTVGSEKLWMGQTHVAPATSSADHHHGESETAIYVVSGRPVFVFADDASGELEEVRLETGPGDYVFVPPYVPHREENPDPDEEAVVVIARSTQEAIVVNLPGLHPLDRG
ncbi:cupin domain-containing protein [Kitasatospora sp. NPDC057015]|uniref:cupin domain-containing protein n=1 Tax=Kitasatospora sp. NPDC057015 TaxID=3346001 RepID=UPI003624EB9C